MADREELDEIISPMIDNRYDDTNQYSNVDLKNKKKTKKKNSRDRVDSEGNISAGEVDYNMNDTSQSGSDIEKQSHHWEDDEDKESTESSDSNWKALKHGI